MGRGEGGEGEEWKTQTAKEKSQLRMKKDRNEKWKMPKTFVKFKKWNKKKKKVHEIMLL